MKAFLLMALFLSSTGAFAFDQCSYKSETVAFRRYQYTSITCTDRHMIDLMREAKINIENQYGDWADMKNSLASSFHHPGGRNKEFLRERDKYFNQRIHDDRGTSDSYRIYYPEDSMRLPVEKLLLSQGYSTVDHVTFVKITNSDRINPVGRVNSSDRGNDKSQDHSSRGTAGNRTSRQ